MSLSSLQAQLAAIQDGAKYSSSRRHDQAKGRGAHFSVHTGARRTPSHRYQPSLLYETAAEAADVPFSTLRTQFEQAIPVLGDLEPGILERADALLAEDSSSSSTTTQTTIRTTLYLIGALLGATEDRDSISLPCLYVLEFLVRKFQLHVDYAVDLFWSCYLTSDQALLQRCWELIDWAQQDQSYAACLRFGCSKGAIRRLVNPQYIDVIRTVVQWTHSMATLPAADPSRAIATSASLLLPALRGVKPEADAQNTALVRTILPMLKFKRSVVGEDFVNWSFCMASALVEAIDVSQLVVDDLCGRILEGSDPPDRSTAVTCVLSILLVPRAVQQNTSLLLAVGEEYWVGCPSFSEFLYKRLVLDDQWWEVMEQLQSSFVITPILITAIHYAVKQEDVGTVEKLIILLTSYDDQDSCDTRLTFDALYSFLQTEFSHEPVLDLLRPFCGDTVKISKPRLLLDDEDSALLYLQQSDLDWKLLASKIDGLSPEHDSLAQAVVAAIEDEEPKKLSADAFLVVAHFVPYYTAATACLLRWVEKKGCKRDIKDAAEKQLNDEAVTLPYLIHVARDHSDCMEFVLKKIMSSSEWKDAPSSDLFDAVVGAFLQTISSSDISVTSATLQQVFKSIFSHRESIEDRLDWILVVADKVQSKAIWNSVSKDLLSSVGAPSLLSACTLPGATNSAVVNILPLITEWNSGEISKLTLPALGFLVHDDKTVRTIAANMISKMSPSSRVLKKVCEEVQQSVGSAQLGGETFLASVLTRACGNKTAKRELLKLCVKHGGQTARILLDATEMAGESAFPLLLRWEVAGDPLFQTLLSNVTAANECLLVSLARMLKGVMLDDPTAVGIISTRRGGGRARSYSMGSIGAKSLDSYPKSMARALGDALKGSNTALVDVLLRDVMSSSSWHSAMTKMPAKVRMGLCHDLVGYVCRESDSLGETTLMGLPLTCEDLVELLSGEEDLAPLSLVVDFVRDNAARFKSAEVAASGLFSKLFGILSSMIGGDSLTTESEFVITSLLGGMGRLISLDTTCGETMERKDVGEWLQSLLSVVLGERIPFTVKSLSVALVAAMSQNGQPSNAPYLVQAAIASIGEDEAPASNRFVLEAASKLLPPFLAVAKNSDFSLTNFYGPWLHKLKSCRERSQQHHLILAFTKMSGSSAEKEAYHSLPSLLGVYLSSVANETEASQLDRHSISFAVEVIECLPQSLQIETLLLFVDTVLGSLSIMQGETPPTVDDSVRSSPSELAAIALHGLEHTVSTHSQSNEKNTRVPILCSTLLSCFRDALLLDDVRWCIGRDSGPLMQMALRLWQELLLLESISRTGVPKDDMSWSAMASLVTDCKEQLQNFLPASVFLASTTALIRDGETKQIKSKALRLIAEKTVHFHTNSPERVLFLGVVPEVVEVVQSATASNQWSHEDSFLAECGFVAIEHISRIFIQAKDAEKDKTSCLEALQLCGKVLEFTRNRGPMWGPLSCAALCSSTLIRSLGPLCLAELPKLMESLLAALQDVAVTNEAAGSMESVKISILRPITTVMDLMPQFCTPFLPKLLSPSGALSPALRDGTNDAVDKTVGLFDETLADSIEPRILIPKATAAVVQQDQLQENLPTALLFKVITKSVEKATPACVGNNRANIMNAVYHSLESLQLANDDGDGENSPNACLDAACTLVETTILKLSELQLRKLYSNLREWKGPPDHAAASKRYAFWTLTARLSTTLRTLFLSCLQLADITEELDSAVKHLCSPPRSASKKRKLNHQQYSSPPGESYRVIFPFLSALESALRADAHQGGTWIRENETKFEAILEPLTKLLHCRVDHDAFEQLVHPRTTGGSVISTLAALASAAGDEHLWKPLNHAVLEACSDDGRPEVRRGGLVCLKELMKVLGEEYITMVPENLPVLSDLLEDPNEEVVTLTKEVITMSEELTGENLADSLR